MHPDLDDERPRAQFPPEKGVWGVAWRVMLWLSDRSANSLKAATAETAYWIFIG